MAAGQAPDVAVAVGEAYRVSARGGGEQDQRECAPKAGGARAAETSELFSPEIRCG
jgi:hypothetical protein